MTTTEKQKKTHNAPLRIAAIIRQLRSVSADMPMQQADVLLSIAVNPGLTLADIGKATSLSPASVSRNLASLSKFHRLGKPGLDLVEVVIDPRETRRRLVYLTPQGKALVTKLSRNVDDSFSLDAETDARVEIERMHEEMAAAAGSIGPKRGQISPKK